MQVFCIQCGSWNITVERALGVPITYLYQCRDCSCDFDSRQWEQYQRQHQQRIAEKSEELFRMKSEFEL